MQKVSTRRVGTAWTEVVTAVRNAVDGRAWLVDTPFVNISVHLMADQPETLLAGETETFHTAVGASLLSTLALDFKKPQELPEDDLRSELTRALRGHLELVGLRRRLGRPPV